jgi:hypothetical protein
MVAVGLEINIISYLWDVLLMVSVAQDMGVSVLVATRRRISVHRKNLKYWKNN